MKTPTKINYLEYETDCTITSKYTWDKLMKNKTVANTRIVNRLVKKHLPDLYNSLALNLCNPYQYYKTSTHLILVHSSIEYFLRYKL